MNSALNLALPGNPRYQPSSMMPFFGYDYNYVPVAQVELAAMGVLADIGIIPADDWALMTPHMVGDVGAIRTTVVDELEAKLRHDIRALVRTIQEVIAEPLRRWVHVPLTSYDPLETGRTLQYLMAHNQVLMPKLRRVISILAGLVRKYASTLQIGRTHGQHAIPITVGFWLATILSRMVYNAQQMDHFAAGLVGKISGAVGASNAVEGLGLAEMCGKISFEERVLDKLSLKPARISTQILPPEPLTYYLFSILMEAGVFGQLGRDCRHLMRSEIAEIGEPFSAEQVGSSTMAQKRNPINFENLEGTWLRTKKEFGGVLDTIISEHQRDLVGSSLARDFPIIPINLCLQLEKMLSEDKAGVPFLGRLTVNPDSCRRNFELSAKVILAEPIYIALQASGFMGDAHELINRHAVGLSQKRSQPLIQSVRELAESGQFSGLAEALAAIPHDTIRLFEHPEDYTGDARRKAMEIAEMAASYASAA